MSIARALPNQYHYQWKNWTRSSWGSSHAPANGSKSAYTSLVTAANIPTDIYSMMLWIHSHTTTATTRPLVIDLGMNLAGGTSYTILGLMRTI